MDLVDRRRRVHADHDVALPWPHSEASAFVGEAVRGDAEQPRWTWPQQAVGLQKVVQFGELLVELEQYVVFSRPPGERDPLRAVQEPAASDGAARGARDSAP